MSQSTGPKNYSAAKFRSMSSSVSIFEVGPRDGLQNQSKPVATELKVDLVNRLAASGLRKIEVTSFVSPRWVPQLSDAGELMDKIDRRFGVTYAALVPNQVGLDAAIEHQADEIALFTAASDAFNLKNTNASIEESLKRFEPMIEVARAHRIAVRGYVSTIVDCPYSGLIEPQRVLDVAQRLLDMGCYEISLGDTLGNAIPGQTDALLNCLLQQISPQKLAGHFHDTSGRALENISTCLEFGLRSFDASVGGLGGCPYAPGAQGNVATESMVRHLHELGYETGVDLDRLELAIQLATSLKA